MKNKEQERATSGEHRRSVSGLTLGMELCAALTAAVGRSGFHGGVRPDNISLKPDARRPLLGPPLEHTAGQFTQQELEFMAPELFWSGSRSPAADVYSVGLTLYAVYNGGRLPFWPGEGEVTQHDRAVALQRRMQGETIVPPSEAPEELSRVLLRALSFRAEERWYDPEELRAALGDCSESPVENRTAVPERVFALAGSPLDRPPEKLSEVERMMAEIIAAREAAQRTGPAPVREKKPDVVIPYPPEPVKEEVPPESAETEKETVQAEETAETGEEVAPVEENMKDSEKKPPEEENGKKEEKKLPAATGEPKDDAAVAAVTAAVVAGAAKQQGGRSGKRGKGRKARRAAARARAEAAGASVPPAPEVVEESVPETVEEPAPEAVEESVPETVEEPAPEAVEESVSETVEESVPEAFIPDEEEEGPVLEQVRAVVEEVQSGAEAGPTRKAERPLRPEAMPTVMWADCDLPKTDNVPEERKPRRLLMPMAILVLLVGILVFLLTRCQEETGPGSESPVPSIPAVTAPEETPAPGETVSPSPEVSPEPESSPTPTPAVSPEPGPEDSPEPEISPEPEETPVSTPGVIPSLAPVPEFVPTKQDCTWEQAAAACEELGGHLAVARTREEFDELVALATENNIRMLWLGAKPDENGDWYWATGEKMDFAIWGENEPSGQDLDGTPEDCLLLWRNNQGVWCFNDCRNDPLSVAYIYYVGQMGYICQFDR